MPKSEPGGKFVCMNHRNLREYLNGTEISQFSLFTLNYRKRENQLTKALLQIFKAGGYDFLMTFAREFEIDIPDPYVIKCQVSTREENKNFTVPDGLIECCPFRILIESKIVQGNISENQLKGHYKLLKDSENYPYTCLLYITPDNQIPDILNESQYEGIFWIKWQQLLTFICKYASLHPGLQYLTDALMALWNDRTFNPRIDLPKEKLTVILAGRIAEPEALAMGIYHCQPCRYFWDARYMAFYNNKCISYLFRIIEGPYKDTSYPGDDCYRLELVKKFEKPIINNKTDKAGRPTPYTMGSPRYISVDAIQTAEKTSDLQ